jgi:hypothetical protein
MTITSVTDLKCIATLPKSDHEWGICQWGPDIILTNPDHAPRLLHPDGTVEVIEPDAPL